MKTSNKLIVIFMASLGAAILALGILYEIKLKPGARLQRPVMVQATGHIKTVTQTYNSLQHVKISGPFQLVLKPGTANRVVFSADEALLNNVVFEPHTTGLDVGLKSSRVFVTDTPMKLEITSNTLSQLTLLGGNISVDAKALNQPFFMLEAAGDGKGIFSGDVKQFVINTGGRGEYQVRDMTSENMTFNVSGSVNVKASGKANKLTVVGTGAGSVDATHMAAENVIVALRGATKALVSAEKTLSMFARGASVIKYHGHPEITKNDVNGGARVEALD